MADKLVCMCRVVLCYDSELILLFVRVKQADSLFSPLV